MSKFENALLESGSIMRRGYSLISENAGKLIALIAAALAILLTFANIELPSVVSRGLGADMAVMVIAAYVIYFSLEDAGERLGRTTEAYTSAELSYRKRVAEVGGTDVAALREFCIRYSREELEYRRRAAMLSLGISEAEYESAKEGKLSGKQRRSVQRIERMKPIELTPKTLLGTERRRGSSELRDPERHKLLRLLIGLLPSTLCMLFTVSMMITAKSGLDLGSIISGIVKLSTLPVIAMRGYSQGYDYARLTLPVWLGTKEKILDAFLAERG